MTDSNFSASFITALTRQEHAAFNRLVKQFHRKLLAFARSMVGPNLAEDVLQDAWTSIYRGLPGYAGRASLSTWLYTIVRNECIARLRSEGRMQTVSIDGWHGHDEVDDWFEQAFVADGHWAAGPGDWHLATPEALLEESQLQDCLESNIRSLRPTQQQVFRMRDLEQMELDDICNVLELTHSNVRVLLHRARLRLQQVVDHYQKTGEC